jgi:uncharacterized protein YbaA (DUF1428 family)
VVRGGKSQQEMRQMKYVDGFVLVVPDEKLADYRKMAKMGEKLWKKYGALEYFECVGDDLASEWTKSTFPKMAKAKEGETIVFSFIVYKSKADRDKISAKVMQDPAMDMEDKPVPFDMKRMAYGGFRVIVGG